MRKLFLPIALFFATISTILSATCFAPTQDHEPKPVLSKDSLSAEQIAVYRAALADYMQEEDKALNLADRTEPFGFNDFQDDKSCLKSANIQIDINKANFIQRLDPAVALSPKMILVDPDQQNETVKKNDAGNLIQRSIEDQHPVTDRELGESVKQAFATGLFTFSEIAFNKLHSRAALKYSFVCGGLCGHGNTLLLKKVDGKWKVSKKCGGWIA